MDTPAARPARRAAPAGQEPEAGRRRGRAARARPPRRRRGLRPDAFDAALVARRSLAPRSRALATGSGSVTPAGSDGEPADGASPQRAPDATAGVN